MGGVIDANVTEFHNYVVTWDSLAIKWYMDEALYFQLNIANGINGTEEFQLPFYLLLNLNSFLSLHIYLKQLHFSLNLISALQY